MTTAKKNPAAVALGKRRWAGKSAEDIHASVSAAGSARAAKLSAARRKAIAKKAAKARWSKKTSATKSGTAIGVTATSKK